MTTIQTVDVLDAFGTPVPMAAENDGTRNRFESTPTQGGIPIGPGNAEFVQDATSEASLASIAAALAGTLSIAAAASSAGGCSTWCATGAPGNALLTNGLVPVKVGAASLLGVSFKNTSTADIYVQMFDGIVTGGSPVVLGTTPAKLPFWVAPGGSCEEKFTGEAKVAFLFGIVLAATAGPTGAAPPAAGLIATVLYK